jgi:Tfp pilus assembly protein PilN
MNDKNSLHFDFLLDTERVSSSPLRLRFIVPVLGLLCLLAPLAVWVKESSHMDGIFSKKQLLQTEIANLKASHEGVLKEMAEVKEMKAQLQQLGFYRNSKHMVGETLAGLTNCVSSRLQLTKLELLTQTPAPSFTGPQVRPATAIELAKLCPTNLMDAVTLRLSGRSVQSGGNPVEVNRFLQALQGKAFASLISPARKPKVTFQEEAASFASRQGSGASQEVVSFEITYDCLPRRFE